MSIGTNIKKYRKASDMTQTEVADSLSLTQGAINSWENGRANPSFQNINKLAKLFKVSVNDLVSEQHDSSTTYPMPPGAKQMEIPEEAAYLPYRGRIHAGDPMEADGIEEVRQVPLVVARAHPQGFLLDVIGDCMNNIYPAGSIIVVDPTLKPQSGDVGAFMLNGEVIMRTVHKGANSLMLSPDSTNPEFTDIFVGGEDELITYGRVVWFQAAKEL